MLFNMSVILSRASIIELFSNPIVSLSFDCSETILLSIDDFIKSFILYKRS